MAKFDHFLNYFFFDKVLKIKEEGISVEILFRKIFFSKW
jgi:hypothetical protein